MPVVSVVQTKFHRGEMGRLMDNRTDLADYSAGCRRLSNMLIAPHGGALRRRGLMFVDDGFTGTPRLHKFSFNAEQEYVFVIGDESVAIYYDNTLAAIASAPWDIDDVWELGFTQSGDTLIVFHREYEPQRITRMGSHTSWSIGAVPFTLIPYFRYNIDQTATPTSTTGAVTVTLSPTTTYFIADHIGTRLRVNGGVIEIGAVTNGYTVTGTVIETLDSTNAEVFWEEEAWSDVHGYPRCGTFHENRLVVRGIPNCPSTIFSSNIDQPFEFDDADPSLEDTTYQFMIASDKAHRVEHLKSAKAMQIFTSDGEFILDGSNDSTIRPRNVRVKMQSEYGSMPRIAPVNVDGQIHFLPRTAKEVRSIDYDVVSDRYVAKNKTLIAHHLFDATQQPVAMTYLKNYANTQGNYVFVVRSDGKMCVMTTDMGNTVYGWAVWDTQGEFLDCVVATADNGDGLARETLYVLVERDNGIFLESLTEDEVYLDCWHIGTSEESQRHWSGIEPLAGMDINVLADGLVQSFNGNMDIPVTDGVDDGEFDLDFPVFDIVAGLQYESVMETMRLFINVGGQALRGEYFRKVAAIIDLMDTATCVVDGRSVAFRSWNNDLLDGPLVPFSGTKEITLGTTKPGGRSKDPTVVVSTNQPLPMNLLGLVTKGKIKVR